MSSLVSCCLCSAHYQLSPDTHRAFCPACVVKLHRDSAEAESHMQLINAGDPRVVPENERQKTTRDNERRRQLRGLS